MFADPGPRLFALPPGADFPALLVAGLRQRLTGQPPEAMARVTLFLNTARMRRRVTDLLTAEGAAFLPRLRLVTDLGSVTPVPGLPAAVPPLRRRLELAQLIAGLMQADPTLAPRAALYDLADSLAELMDEMQGEGVAPTAIADLDVSDHSAHWQRTQAFMAIVAPFFSNGAAPDPQARQGRIIAYLEAVWQAHPPQDPVIVAGSTGSRGVTQRLMQAVARLPQGAIVLPGFDFDMPARVWTSLDDAMSAEDHPQFRFHRLIQTLDTWPQPWTKDPAPSPARNRLVSLSLRPAPVTDQWLTEGPSLGDLRSATQGLTLIEAPTPRTEALAIALILREAAEQGRSAALISPDRGLTRQVTAALDRWRIIPDDSAGRPLALTPPGRLLRHTAQLRHEPLTAEALLVLLKHPLTASDGDRNKHLLFTRNLEMKLRRSGPACPKAQDLRDWAALEKDPETARWADWLAKALSLAEGSGDDALADHVADHLALTEAIAGSPGKLWLEEPGIEALVRMRALQEEAAHGGVMSRTDYADLLTSILNEGVVRETVQSHPGVMIWGTLEARVQGADLVILGGLNDGIWPQMPPADPWMNRQMRLKVGLLLPERRIGLSAHDYQQAIAAREVVLTRATRNAEAETVPSRWLNRLTNLMNGLPDQGGNVALTDMQSRGARWLSLAAAVERPPTAIAPAHRPAPAPPLHTRPKELAVTGIRTLIRDPYAIYARHILRLYRLDPLRAKPDAALRGTVIHSVLEGFVRNRPDSETPDEARTRLMQVTDTVLASEVPWPAARILWRARLERAAEFFLTLDIQSGGRTVVLEEKNKLQIPDLDFTLTAKPDRIDILPDATLRIFDYKTGSPPSKDAQRHFDKQLLLEAVMAERGGFPAAGAAPMVRSVTYVGLGSNPKALETPMTPELLDEVWEGLHKLIRAYQDPAKGYPSRRSVAGQMWDGDYDHLARFGEWEMTAIPRVEVLE